MYSYYYSINKVRLFKNAHIHNKIFIIPITRRIQKSGLKIFSEFDNF